MFMHLTRLLSVSVLLFLPPNAYALRQAKEAHS